MTITRSYNKHTDTYYAYDTTYVWDEKAQKKYRRSAASARSIRKLMRLFPQGNAGDLEEKKALLKNRKPMNMPNMRKFFPKPERFVQG